MRVVHIVSHIGTYGGERFVASLAAAQRRAGLDAHIVTLYDCEPVAGLVVHSCHRRGTAGAARGGGPLFFLRMVRLMRSLRPDVVNTHLAHAKLWGRLGAHAARVPVVVHTEHANEFSESFARRMLTRALDAHTRCIVALSEAQRRRIVRFARLAPDRIHVIENGITPGARATAVDARASVRDALHVSRDARLLLAIGRLDPVKRHDRAIEALAHLPQSYHLVIAGDGECRKALAALAQRVGVQNRVHLLGYRDDVRTLLAAADAVVNTSRSEALPLSLLEALCAGVPVVATPWPGARELLGDAAVTDAETPFAVATAIERAPTRRPAPQAIAAARARFSIERTAERYAALYRALLERTGAPTPTGRKSLAVSGGPD